MIERINNPSYETFLQYRRNKCPVIMRDIINLSMLDPDYIARICGETKIQCMQERSSNTRFEREFNRHVAWMSMREYVDKVTSSYGNDIYMVARNDFNLTAAGRLLLPLLPHPEQLINPGIASMFLWFGPGGTHTPLHYDACDIVLCQAYGTKKVSMCAPEHTHLLYNHESVYSEVDLTAVDLAKYPLACNLVFESFFLNPGDCLFIPAGYWHQIISLNTSISVSYTNFK